MVKQIPIKHITYLSLPSSSTVYAAECPNIIYIFTDQHAANVMSCVGNPDVHTPDLGRLAAAGTMFQNACCTAPLSGPPRGAVFTGHYPGSVELPTNGASLPEALQTQTLGTLIRDAGYECAYGDKWHVPELDIPDEVRGFDQIHRRNDDGLAEAYVQFLSRKHDKPFFLVASYGNPHNICEYTRGQNPPYSSMEIPETRNCPGLPPNSTKNPYDTDVIEEKRDNSFNVYPAATFTPEDRRMHCYAYHRLVEKIDREIGRVIDTIDKNSLWRNTVVIFSNDHGGRIGAHHWNQRSALYGEVVNIPLIVALPGKEHAGEKLSQLISNKVDFFATTCDWTEAGKPESITGRSFRKIAEEGNPQAPHQDYIITETHFDSSKTRDWIVCTERYKYVLYDKGRHHKQLFDMQNDRGETRNLMMGNAYKRIAQQYRGIPENYMNTYKIKPIRPKLHDASGKAPPKKANSHSLS